MRSSAVHYVKRMILGAPYDKKIEFRPPPAGSRVSGWPDRPCLGCSGTLAACAPGRNGPHKSLRSGGCRAPAEPPKTMQWLYGSARRGAQHQAWHAMRDYVVGQAKRGRPKASCSPTVPLSPAPASPLRHETAGSGAGCRRDRAPEPRLNEYDEAVKGRALQPGDLGALGTDRRGQGGAGSGALTALRAIRAAGVTVVFNSNRKAENAASRKPR
jgi:hypothetical protein